MAPNTRAQKKIEESENEWFVIKSPNSCGTIRFISKDTATSASQMSVLPSTPSPSLAEQPSPRYRLQPSPYLAIDMEPLRSVLDGPPRSPKVLPFSVDNTSDSSPAEIPCDEQLAAEGRDSLNGQDCLDLPQLDSNSNALPAPKSLRSSSPFDRKAIEFSSSDMGHGSSSGWLSLHTGTDQGVESSGRKRCAESMKFSAPSSKLKTSSATVARSDSSEMHESDREAEKKRAIRAERKRRDAEKERDAFNMLKSKLPNHRTGKPMSKIKVLKHATEYISHLSTVLANSKDANTNGNGNSPPNAAPLSYFSPSQPQLSMSIHPPTWNSVQGTTRSPFGLHPEASSALPPTVFPPLHYSYMDWTPSASTSSADASSTSSADASSSPNQNIYFQL